MKYSLYTFIALMCVLCLNSQASGDFWFYGLEGDTIAVPVADSILVVAFQSGGPAAGTTPSQLAAQVAGLAEDYEFWELSDGFWVFGVDSSVSVEIALSNALAHPAVGIVNPVVRMGTNRIMWMTELAIVRFLPDVTQAEIDSLNELLGFSILYSHPFLLNQYVLALSRGRSTDLLSAIQACSETGLTVFAEPNLFGPANFTSYPNDPLYPYQWHFRNDGGAGLADADIDADLAWMVTTGSPDVVVAVLDGGVQFYHPDLVGMDTVAAYDAAGYNVKCSCPLDPDDDPSSSCEVVHPFPTKAHCWHGTAVTGEIFARSDNQEGLAGLAPTCRLMPVKISDDNGLWRADAIEAAINHTYRASTPADIASCSWTWYEGPGSYSPAIKLALDSAYAHGVSFVFAAGNYEVVEWPATLPKVIACGATNPWDLVYSWSGRDTTLDVVAPGGEIWSTDPTGDIGLNPNYAPCTGDPAYYCDYWGTSFAAPLVAGTIALVLSRCPELKGDVEGLRSILYNTAEDKGDPGWDASYGHGRINAYRALLSVIGCSCHIQCDYDEDSLLTALDLGALIDVLFAGVPEIEEDTCPTTRGDFDFDGFPSALDLGGLIDHLFAGQPGPCEPCDPVQTTCTP